jgi:hypothetical protein
MNQEPRRDSINDGGKNEKKRGNHFTESIRPVRYAKRICYSRVSACLAGALAEAGGTRGQLLPST